MEITEMTEANIKEVAEVFRNAFNHVGENWSSETALAHVSQNFFGDAHWVATENSEIIGFLMSIRLTREHGEELFVDSVAVLPEHRGKEVGKKLWQLAEQYVVDNNLYGLRLLANPNLKSYEWYEKMGFKQSGWVELAKARI